MNKTLLKNFATAARIRLMDDVRYRLGLMGITAKGILAPAHQSLDMEAYEYAKGQTFRLTGQEVAARRTLADMVRARGFEQVVEEVAYTWFNRLIAIRFMEVNDYLPHHTRVLSSITPGQTTPDIVTRALEVDLGLTDKEKQQVLEWKLNNQTDDLFRFMFLKQCQQLAGLLPGLFSGQGSVVSGQLAGVSGLSSAGHWSLKTDHLSLLLTISHINPDGIVAQLLKIPESYFNVNQADEDGEATGQVEIIGWLYQYYNSELKDDTFAQLKKNIKISKERIPAATQLFTPQWIVKYMVENSLGRLWVEKLLADGDSRTEAQIAEAFGWRYYLPAKSGQGSGISEQGAVISNQSFNPVPTDHCPLTTDHSLGSTDHSLGSTDHLSSPEDLRFLDPAMGSGHILVYAFDALLQIYLSRGYGAAEAARLIVEKNLHGLDIDDRAWQLAYFAVMMKARQHRRQALTEGLQPHLYAVQSSQGLSEQQLQYFGKSLSCLERNTARDQAEEMLQLFKDGKLLGSIIRVPDWDLALLERFAMDFTLPKQVDLLSDLYAERAQPHLLGLVRIAQVMQQRYHAVVTNPPYMGSSGMNAALSSYVKEEYPDSKSDLFAVFMERCLQWTVISDQWSGVSGQSGYVGMITQHAWMFLSSYEKLRGKLLKQQEIINMAHLGARAFEEIGGEVVQTTAFVLGKKAAPGYLGTYARLIEPTTQDGKEEMFLLMKKGSEQCSVISDQTPALVPADHCSLTTDHSFHHADQQNFTKIPGAPVAYWAGAPILVAFEKGVRMDALVNPRQGLATTDNNKFIRQWYEVPYHRITFHARNIEDAKNIEGLKWVPYNKGGERRQWYGNYDYVVDWTNDGKEIKENVLRKYPYLKTPDFVVKNTQFYFLEAITWGLITSGGFSIRYRTPGGIHDVSGMSAFTDNHQLMMYLLALMSTHLADYFFKMVNPTINLQIGDFNIFPVIIAKEQQARAVALAEECVALSKEEWDAFETSWDFETHPLICLAQQRNHWHAESATIQACYDVWEKKCEERFQRLKANEEELNRTFIDIYGLQKELKAEVALKDVTIRQADKSRDVRSLLSYAVGCMFGRYHLSKRGLQFAGNDWNKFHQEMILTSSEAESNFPVDADGILPITDEEYFADDITEKFVAFIRLVYGEENTEENLRFVADALGGSGTARDVIRSYFLKDFYKDHVKTYKKRPIYWLFDSGKQNGFKALIYLHRYDRDTLGRVRVDYLHRLQAMYENAVGSCDSILSSNASTAEKGRTTKRREKLLRQLDECRSYDQALAHLANQRIQIDLDDGVKHNYALFQGVELAREGRRAVKVDLLAGI